MSRAGSADTDQSASRSERLRLARWNSLVTTPALVAVWAAGLYLATRGGWFPALWLQLKLACVFMLSILHAFQTLRLRKLTLGRPASAMPGWVPLLAALFVLTIIYLVSAKPA
jgi:putative membrane protein